ncbi:putative nucleotidyltransferase substrate binding domain-containing protein [Paracoccaceae bacterium GXU_MW_L88]
MEMVAPFDRLPEDAQAALTETFETVTLAPGEVLVDANARLPGMWIVRDGHLDVLADDGSTVAVADQGQTYADRELLKSGQASARVVAPEGATLSLLSRLDLEGLLGAHPGLRPYFRRSETSEDSATIGLTALPVRSLMTADPVTCAPETSVTEVAQLMREKNISSVIVAEDGAMQGIVTHKDLTHRVLAEGRDGTMLAKEAMRADGPQIGPDDMGLDALLKLSAAKLTHLPVVAQGRAVGVLAQSDLVRRQAATASQMIGEIANAASAEDMKAVMARVPAMLAQLVSTGAPPHSITRRVTDITDAITRRLIAIFEADHGPAPAEWLWLACGSQGRQEQTGVSDQDNCMILSKGADPDDPWFVNLATFVSDGLDTVGFFYCPGDMMATNPRWRQPINVWERYFRGWIDKPDSEAQMLASVMFDLRPIQGDAALFDGLQEMVLRRAAKNSIFVAHLASNALKHQPPLGLFRNIAVIRSGEHKNHLDMKLSGVVPIIDLARIYTIQGRITAVNTRARLKAAQEAGIVSQKGGRDLIDAYDYISQLRLEHQAKQLRAGERPDNFMSPASLSDFEQGHLRDAFSVVKTMQSALGSGKATLG